MPPWWLFGILVCIPLWISSVFDDGTTYYYYESSTYTQTVINTDGRVETKRQESTRTNMDADRMIRSDVRSLDAEIRSLDAFVDRLLDSSF